jgi:hypothetical protein
MATLDGIYFGQETPRLQLKAIHGAMAGWMNNLRDGRSSAERVSDHVDGRLKDMRLILDRCPDLDKWPESS